MRREWRRKPFIIFVSISISSHCYFYFYFFGQNVILSFVSLSERFRLFGVFISLLRESWAQRKNHFIVIHICARLVSFSHVHCTADDSAVMGIHLPGPLKKCNEILLGQNTQFKCRSSKYKWTTNYYNNGWLFSWLINFRLF